MGAGQGVVRRLASVQVQGKSARPQSWVQPGWQAAEAYDKWKDFLDENSLHHIPLEKYYTNINKYKKQKERLCALFQEVLCDLTTLEAIQLPPTLQPQNIEFVFLKANWCYMKISPPYSTTTLEQCCFKWHQTMVNEKNTLDSEEMINLVICIYSAAHDLATTYMEA